MIELCRYFVILQRDWDPKWVRQHMSPLVSGQEETRILKRIWKAPEIGEWLKTEGNEGAKDAYDYIGCSSHRSFETVENLTWDEFQQFMSLERLGYSGEGGFMGFPGDVKGNMCLHFSNNPLFGKELVYLADASVIPEPPESSQPGSDALWDQIREELRKEFPSR